MPGWNNSALITIAKAPPSINIESENHKYIDPMSLWLVVYNHLLKLVALGA
jgi:hypothetical protein